MVQLGLKNIFIIFSLIVLTQTAIIYNYWWSIYPTNRNSFLSYYYYLAYADPKYVVDQLQKQQDLRTTPTNTVIDQNIKQNQTQNITNNQTLPPISTTDNQNNTTNITKPATDQQKI